MYLHHLRYPALVRVDGTGPQVPHAHLTPLSITNVGGKE
jgi:hypothetical protein